MATRMGVADLSRVYNAEELAQGEVMFAATGVTDGDLLRGVRFFSGGARIRVSPLPLAFYRAYTVRCRRQ